jgi:hypothetical protein
MEKAIPRKRVGRPAKLTDAQTDTLEAFVTSSQITRKMSYQALTDHFR